MHIQEHLPDVSTLSYAHHEKSTVQKVRHPQVQKKTPWGKIVKRAQIALSPDLRMFLEILLVRLFFGGLLISEHYGLWRNLYQRWGIAGALVTLEDGRRMRFRAVLGTDGIRSRVAASLGMSTPNYAGYAAYRSELDAAPWVLECFF